MGDVTYDLLTDRTKYPDEAEITLADGTKITVKEFRDKVLPKPDFTKASEGWAARERQYKEALDAASTNLARAMEEKQALEAAQAAKHGQPVPPAGTPTEEELLADPFLGKLYRDMKDASQRLEAHEKRLQQHEQTWTKSRFLQQIADLKKRDADLNVDEFLAYAQKRPVIDVDNQIVDLDATYTNYAHGRLLETARKAGEEEGVKKGKAAATVPAVPFGRRRAPVRPEGLPGSLQELTDEQVMADPEMQAAMNPQE